MPRVRSGGLALLLLGAVGTCGASAGAAGTSGASAGLAGKSATSAAAASGTSATSGTFGTSGMAGVDDLQDGGRGADPIPLSPTKIRLRAAELRLNEVPVQEAWQVEADYDLQNAGAAAKVSVMVPQGRCASGGRCSPQSGELQELSVRLGETQLAAGASSAEQVGPWIDPGRTGVGYLYELAVPAGGTRRLSLEYRLDRSVGSGYYSARVVSSAGRWGAPVGQVRVVVAVKHATPYVWVRRPYGVVGFTERKNERGAGSVTTVTLEAAGLDTRSDFAAVFPADRLLARTAAGECAGFRGEADEAVLRKEIASYDGARLRACAELVAAVHGVAGPRAQLYGSGKVPRPAWAEGYTLVVRPAARAGEEALLSPGEAQYLKLLEEERRRRK